MTFQEQFCAQNRVAAADFESALLQLTLYPAARVLRPLLGLSPRYFEDEILFVRQVGAIRRPDDYLACEAEYLESEGYRGFLHRRLRLRISCRRMRMAVRSFRLAADDKRREG
jgi:hypothetical protein